MYIVVVMYLLFPECGRKVWTFVEKQLLNWDYTVHTRPRKASTLLHSPSLRLHHDHQMRGGTMLEAEIVRKGMAKLKDMNGVRPIKIVGGDSQEAGVSDILVCVQGRFCAIEVKRKEGGHRVSMLQAKFLNEIEDIGGYAAVCRSVGEIEDAVMLCSFGVLSNWQRHTPQKLLPSGIEKLPRKKVPSTYA